MSLTVELERPLPREVPRQSATAIVCTGACLAASGPVAGLEILVDGRSQDVAAYGMPRPDLVAAGVLPRAPHARDSGFWATVALPARAASDEPIAVDLRATLAGGGVETVALARIAVVEPEPPVTVGPVPRGADAAGAAEVIAVCMATHEPDAALLAIQIESLRAQTDDRWVCLISDDCSSPERFAEIERLVGGDPRFAVSRSDRRLGFYRNFERALRMAPSRAGLVALCDQDDRWDPTKLGALRAGLGDAILVYSDLRLTEADGTVRRSTLWRGRSNNYTSLTSMLVANTITGAAMLFRRELLTHALPFPDTPGFQFHDTWLAVIALAAGRVAYVDAPLYDYVQHPAAVFGDVTHGARERPGLTRRLQRLRAGDRRPAWRSAYFYGYLPREARAKVALARCGAWLRPHRRRELERFIACDASLAPLARLALRPARALTGRIETLGGELALVRGLIWKRLTQALAHHRLPAPAGLADASIPPPQSYSETRLRRWRSRL